jgi:hypothetical protein
LFGGEKEVIIVNGKQFAIGIVLAIVLLPLAFIPLSSQQGGGTYDPWLDYNGDGKIDVNDLHPLGQAYGTSGDPTRDVRVTNWPLDGEGNLKVRTEQYSHVIHVMDGYGPVAWFPGGGWFPTLPLVYVGNYSTMFVYLRVTDISPDQEGTTTFRLRYLGWRPESDPYSYDYYFEETVDSPNLTLWSGNTAYAYAKFEVKAPYVEFGVYLNTTLSLYEGQARFWLWVYLRNQ